MKNKKIKMLLLAIVLSISCFLTCFVTTNVVYASSIGIVGGYTNVLEDLQKDDTFNADDYPVVQDDYSLQVITIAESSDKELFVYVYQPSANYGNLKATTINISKSLHNKLTFTNYKLTLINSYGVFYKYLANGISVENSSTRYYEISSIFRAWNSAYDEDTGNDNTISEVSFKVAKQFTLVGNGEDIVTSVADTEVITITDKYVGFVRYYGGNSYVFCLESCDSHFVAFSTDKQIDKLLEADVYFQTQRACFENGLDGVDRWDFYDVKDNYSYITEYDTAFYESPSSAWQGYSYSWSRIQSVKNFFDTEDFESMYQGSVFNQKVTYNLSEECRSYMENMQWVLRFYESSYDETRAPYPTLDYTIVSNVSILRLKFETDSVVYDLGVVDNKQSGSLNPSNNIQITTEFSDVFKSLMLVLFLILLVVVLSPILPTIFNIIWAIIKYIFKALVWLISAPFKLIGKVFKKRE